MRTENTQVGGKWSSGGSLDEQVSAAEIVGDQLDFVNEYRYKESDITDTRLDTAVVRGFWIEKDPSSSDPWRFAVNMELRGGSEPEMFVVRFKFRCDESGDPYNQRLEVFLKIFGVDDDSVSSIIGRKCLYKDLRDKQTNNTAIMFYNNRLTALSHKLQSIVLTTLFGSVMALITFGAFNRELAVLSLFTMIASVIIGVLNVLLGQSDYHGFASVNEYQVESPI